MEDLNPKKNSNEEIAELIIRKIIDSIYTDDEEEFKEYIDKYPVSKLSAKRQVQFVDVLVSQAYEYNREEFIPLIFKVLDDANDGAADYSTFALYMMYSGASELSLGYIGKYIDTTFEETIHELNRAPLSNLTYEGCLRAEQVFGKPSEEVLRKLEAYVYMDPKDINVYIVQYIKDRLETTLDYVSPPEWVVNFTDDPDLPKQENISVPKYPKVLLPSPYKAAKLLLKYSKDKHPIFSQAEYIYDIEAISTVYGMLTLEEKAKMLAPIRENISGVIFPSEDDIEDDSVLFAIYGPTNTNLDQYVRPNYENECSRYGGCRMFLCVCNEQEDPLGQDYSELEETNYEDWFTGNCQSCHSKIKYRHYAIREPQIQGGWRGCFCSIKCLSEQIDKNPVLQTMLNNDILGKMLNDNGIQDRRYTDKEQTIMSVYK
jgi:hypothetical protein